VRQVCLRCRDVLEVLAKVKSTDRNLRAQNAVARTGRPYGVEWRVE
jgi:hypothetical protein